MNHKQIKTTILLTFFLLLSCNLFALNLSATDGLNRKINLKSVPQKIISLGAASTEILFAAGAKKQIAAVSEYSDFPPEAKNLPVIGGFDGKTISTEKLMAYEPDFVILYKGMHDFLIPFLDKYKIDYYVSDAQTINSVINEIYSLSVLTGHEKKGKELVSKYKNEINQYSENKNTVSVYWEVCYEPFMSAGKSSFINDLISIAGGKNIFAEVDQAYPVVSEESIIAANPDFILIPASSRTTAETVKNRRGWNEISAVKNGKVIIINDDIYNRPGPRVFEAIKELNSLINEK